MLNLFQLLLNAGANVTINTILPYNQLQKKVYTFRYVEYSEGSGPEMNLGGAQYSL